MTNCVANILENLNSEVNIIIFREMTHPPFIIFLTFKPQPEQTLCRF
jgi:hypothetical protein